MSVVQRTEEGVGIGWKGFYADHRDLHFADRRRMRQLAVLPDHVDWYEHQSPVRNQKDEGSCVGHGVSAGVDWLRRTEHRTDASHAAADTVYSPRWTYRWARQLEGGSAETVDGGAYVRLGVKAMAKVGICQESSWRYISGQFADEPPFFAKSQAHRWRLGEYNACDDITAILNALADGHPVVGGFECHTGMWTREVDRTGMLPMPGPRDREDGGHCVLFCGYDRNIRVQGSAVPGVLLFKNSWSETWGSAFGHRGYGLLPMEFMHRRLADDMWAMIAEA